MSSFARAEARGAVNGLRFSADSNTSSSSLHFALRTAFSSCKGTTHWHCSSSHADEVLRILHHKEQGPYFRTPLMAILHLVFQGFMAGSILVLGGTGRPHLCTVSCRAASQARAY